MDKDRLKEKCLKLLAMSEDKSSPNEAATALRMLHKLMNQHGMSIDDIRNSKKSDFAIAEFVYGKSRVPRIFDSIAIAVAVLNDCIAMKTVCGGYIFKGYDLDAHMSVHMVDYLINAAKRDKERFRAVSGESATIVNDYQRGWVHEVSQRLKAMHNETLQSEAGKALVPLKMAMVAQEFGAVKYGKYSSRPCDATAYYAGVADGSRVSLNQQIA